LCPFQINVIQEIVRMSTYSFSPAVVEMLESRMLLSGTIVQFDTNMGSFQVQLYDEATPATVANFLDYLNRGAYDSTVIHRSVPGFIVQGGGFSFPTFEEVTAKPPVINEPGISNTRGTIAMAKLPPNVPGGGPDSATNQWFFNLDDNASNLDFQNGGFTVFGEIIESGMDIVDAIAALQTWNFGGAFSDFPLRNDPDFADPSWEPTADDVVLVHRVSVVLEVNLGAGLPANVTFADPDGTLATAIYASRTGVATLRFTGQNLQQIAGRRGAVTLAGDNVQLEFVTITGSTARDSFVINARGGADGRIDMGGLFADGGLRAINAPNVNVNGSVGVADGLGLLSLGNVSGGNIIVSGVARGLSVRLDNVADVSLLSGTPLTLLRVNQWIDTDVTPDQIIAPSVANLQSAGDFQAALDLSGGGRATLGRANLGGGLGGVTWNVTGNAGQLAARSIAPGFTGNFSGQLAGVRVAEDAHGTITANSIGNLHSTGNFFANLILSGEGARRGVALGRANIAGALGAADWNINGNAGLLNAQSITPGFNGNFSGNLASLRVAQDASGNFSASTIPAVNVQGNLHDGQIVLSQPGGTRAAAFRSFNVGQAIVGFDILAIADLGPISAAAIHDSLIATQGMIRGLTVRPGGTFANTNVFAASMGNANLGVVLIHNGGVPFGITTGSITRLDLTPAGGDPIRFVRLTDQETFTSFIVNSGIDLGDFGVNIV
jgi:peptidyl-prolyl cis-trans isomerase A (cyclophilin A)